MSKQHNRSRITHMGRPDGGGNHSRKLSGAVEPKVDTTKPEDVEPDEETTKDEVTCPDCGHKFVPDEKDEANDEEEEDDEGELSNQDTNLKGLNAREQFAKLNSRTAPRNR